MTITLYVKVKGGPGSGNYGHSGRPGMVGGSGGTTGGTIANLNTATRQELESAGYVAVFRGVGPRGAREIRPSETGQLGSGVYFYDDALQAKSYAQPGGGIVTGFVHEDDVSITDVPGDMFALPHRVVVLRDASKFIRRGNVPTDATRFRSWKKDEVAEFNAIVERALEAE